MTNHDPLPKPGRSLRVEKLRGAFAARVREFESLKTALARCEDGMAETVDRLFADAVVGGLDVGKRESRSEFGSPLFLRCESSSRVPSRGDPAHGVDSSAVDTSGEPQVLILDRFELVESSARRFARRNDAGDVPVELRATDIRHARRVVLHLVPASHAEQLRAAWHAQRELDHPSILRAVEFVADDEHAALVSADVRGTSLAELLRAHDGATEALGCACRRACEALAYAHARGVVHGDLRPEHVYLASDGRVLLSGWSGARRVSADGQLPGGGPSGRDAGNATARSQADDAGAESADAFMAPELLRGGGTTVQTDVWAVGVLLYRIVSGALPWEGACEGDPVADADVSRRRQRLLCCMLDHSPAAPSCLRDLPSLSRLSPERLQSLDRVALRCLQVSPAARYDSAASVLEALDEV